MTDSPPPHPRPPSRRAVLLRHTLADGTWHVDWMLERESGEERRLVTFRLGVRPDEAPVGQGEGTRLPDHRARYLDYEGSLSDARGSVARVARGDVLSLTVRAEAIEARIRWADGLVSVLTARESQRGFWILRWAPAR